MRKQHWVSANKTTMSASTLLQTLFLDHPSSHCQLLASSVICHLSSHCHTRTKVLSTRALIKMHGAIFLPPLRYHSSELPWLPSKVLFTSSSGLCSSLLQSTASPMVPGLERIWSGVGSAIIILSLKAPLVSTRSILRPNNSSIWLLLLMRDEEKFGELGTTTLVQTRPLNMPPIALECPGLINLGKLLKTRHLLQPKSTVVPPAISPVATNGACFDTTYAS